MKKEIGGAKGVDVFQCQLNRSCFNNFRSILRPLSQVGPYTFKCTCVFGK